MFGNFYAQQALWNLKVKLFKVGLAILAGVFMWAWVAFDLHVPGAKQHHPRPTPTVTVTREVVR